MKKFLILISCILAISAATIAGCSKTEADNNLPDNSYNLIQENGEQNAAQDESRPEPRTPRTEKRTDDGDCGDGKDECPHCKPRRPRRPHGGNRIQPVPLPAPSQPKH